MRRLVVVLICTHMSIDMAVDSEAHAWVLVRIAGEGERVGVRVCIRACRVPRRVIPFHAHARSCLAMLWQTQRVYHVLSTSVLWEAMLLFINMWSHNSTIHITWVSIGAQHRMTKRFQADLTASWGGGSRAVSLPRDKLIISHLLVNV